MIPRARIAHRASRRQWQVAALKSRLRPQIPPLRPPGTAIRERLLSTTAPRLQEVYNASKDLHRPPRTGPTPSEPANAPGPEPEQPRRRPRLGLFPMVYLALGFVLGIPVVQFFTPPPAPAPGSQPDVTRARVLAKDASRLALVQRLSPDPAWESWPAYAAFHPAPSPSSSSSDVSSLSSPLPPGATSTPPRPDRLTTGPLAGTRGIGGLQTVFHHRATSEFVTVVHFGPATSGWPGIVHGGALATLLDESLGRCAIRHLDHHTGVTARLEVRYLRPTTAGGGFHVIRVRPVPEEDLDVGDRGKRGRKVWCTATLETTEGEVCVEARGLFVAPKGITLQRLGDRF